ncbi:MobH family relaxase [Thauera butanivorans]|uniref:MobH family relaxase n=1 Tax=Thauera butanivorans TaxID=86174 RepID=UPI00083845D2|nr:MobH family relaxase [Thauera butanivorans]
MIQVETVAGVGLLVAGIGAGAWLWLQHRQPSQPAPPPAHATEPVDKFKAPEATLPVQTFKELVQTTGVDGILTRTRAASALNPATWDGHVLPVFDHVAELVQLLPASESHHHANPGGLFVHLCETVEAAVQLRRGVILPPGRQADDVSQLKHRWTVGLVIAALLHDIGKPVSDVRIRLYGPGLDGVLWNAMAGSMLDAGARAYAVDFPPPGERDYQSHQRLGALLMQRLVPAKTMAWMAEDGQLMRELIDYLSGEASGKPGALADLVKRGEAKSVSTNLRSGPRTRFASARAVPLIERLMSTLRRMLAEGSHLPLNRPGAVGYVYEGEVWFAAARLANAVRDYLIAHESAAAVPGPDKNDRFFDAWQDYGACLTNPATGRAIWAGRVEFEPQISNAGYELPAMLRFPVELLFRAEHLPQPMPGRIVAITGAVPGSADPASETVPSGEGAEPASSSSPGDEPVADTVAPKPATESESAPVQTPVSTAPPAAPPPPSPPKSTQSFLDEDDAASSVPPPIARRSAPKDPSSDTLKPVSPAIALPPGKPAKGAPSSGAVAFMAWVQHGVADGSLPYNTTGAMVHFVKYGEKVGVLLVNPSIFRQYASTEPERGKRESDAPGQATQRVFSNSGWHIKGPSGKNIWPYQVMRSGEKGGNLLNGFLILEPERFFDPVPPPNDRLVLWNGPAAGSLSSSKKERDGISS